MRGLAAVLIALVACVPRGRPAVGPAPIVVHGTPPAVDAAHALILGTDRRDGSSLVPLAPRPVTLALGATEVVLTAAPGGAAPPASGVIARAALAAEHALGAAPGELGFAASVHGPAPGPTDAAALAAGFIAAATGATTGRALPAPVPVDAAELALDADQAAALDASYARWRQRLAGEWGSLLLLAGAGVQPPALAALRDAALRDGAEAERLHAAGDRAAAREQVIIAWQEASAANQLDALRARARTGELDAALADLGATPQAARTLAALAARHPVTLDDHLALFAASAYALRAAQDARAADAALAAARRTLASPAAAASGPSADARVAELAAPAVRLLARARADLARSDDALAWTSPSSRACTCSIGRIARAATATASAADTDSATDTGTATAAAPALLALARADLALPAALATADATARASARQARIATGAIPASVRLAYQTAHARTAAPDDARFALWLADALAQTAVLLATPPRAPAAPAPAAPPTPAGTR